MLRLGQFLIGTILTGLLAGFATAAPFSDLFVFGDSLSDMGNVAQATRGIAPGPYYYDGRVTNGPVHAELLAAELGLELTRSLSGGNNFAHAGAQTSGTGGIAGIFIQDVDEQVDAFVGNRSVGPSSLFILLAGANDLISDQSDVNVPVDNLLSDIERLVAADARQMLVMNLPHLGLVPRFSHDPTSAAVMTQTTIQFNAALDAALDEFEVQHDELTLFRLDIATLFSDLVTDPTAYGLANVTDPAAPGLQPGDSSYDTSQIVDDPSTYLFWDDLHPTSTVHALLAQEALAAVVVLGDYNGDRRTDAADFTIWRDTRESTSDLRADGNFDAVVDLADYQLWKQHFSNPSNNTEAAGIPVPEPSASMWVIGLLAVLAAGYRSGGAPHIGRCMINQ